MTSSFVMPIFSGADAICGQDVAADCEAGAVAILRLGGRSQALPAAALVGCWGPQAAKARAAMRAMRFTTGGLRLLRVLRGGI